MTIETLSSQVLGSEAFVVGTALHGAGSYIRIELAGESGCIW